MGMTAGWLSQASAERFIIEQSDYFNKYYRGKAETIATQKCRMRSGIVFCIVVIFDSNTKHYLTEADVRFMTGEQSYVI